MNENEHPLASKPAGREKQHVMAQYGRLDAQEKGGLSMVPSHIASSPLTVKGTNKMASLHPVRFAISAQAEF